MTNNDVLRSLRYMLKIHNPKMSEICQLGGYTVTTEEIQNLLKPEPTEGELQCSDELLACFLDGVIVFKRGKDPARPLPPIELPVSNNLILKKLRVAFQLQEQNMIEILESSGFKISKGELSGLMRKRDHINYRDAGDQVLRNFLKGLTQKLHTPVPTPKPL